MSIKSSFVALLISSMLYLGCKSEDKNYIWKSKVVTVSAYNTTPAQTDSQSNIAAWGDTLAPNMNVIAVSRDLVQIGLVHNTQVKIEGLDGTYFVKDKMHHRWRNKIDLYMGTDVKKAKEWGKKQLKIQYRVKKDGTETIE